MTRYWHRPYYYFSQLTQLAIQPLLKVVLKSEFRDDVENARDYIYERPLEYSFCLQSLAKNHCRTVLDIGTGKSAFPAVLRNCGFVVTCLDKKQGYWSIFNTFNRHSHIFHSDICQKPFPKQQFDAVVCLSVLEHIPDYEKAVENMVRLTKPSGVLIFTFPYQPSDYCPDVYQLPEAKGNVVPGRYIAQSFNDAILDSWLNKYNLELQDTKYFRGWTGRYWKCGDRISHPYFVENKSTANGICITMKRRGADEEPQPQTEPG